MSDLNYRTIWSMTYLGLLLPVVVTHLYGQSGNPADPTVPYYIPLERNDEPLVYDLYGDILSLRFDDVYGQEPGMILDIYDWKRDKLANLLLDKRFGINHYSVDLKKIGGTFMPGNVYSIEVSDDRGNLHRAWVKPIEDEDTTGPGLNLFVNPLQVECSKGSESTMEFYAHIEGGRAPFQVYWYFLNENRNSLLYQPVEQFVDKPGSTPKVTVDQPLSYHVLLLVKDICGNEKQQAVQLACDQGQQKVNTLFVEPLQEMVDPTQNGN